QTSPRPAPTRKAPCVAPLSSWAAHEQVWPFPSLKRAHYWASSSFTARRCGRSPRTRSHYCKALRRRRRLLVDQLKAAAAEAVAALDADKRADIYETIAILTGNLDKIAEHGRRADNIVKSMLEHSRGVSGERQSVDISALVDEALNLAYHGARAQDQ